MKIGKAACAHIGQFRASEQTFLWAFFHQLVTIMTMKRVCNVYNEKTHIPVCCSDFPKMIPNNFLYWYGWQTEKNQCESKNPNTPHTTHTKSPPMQWRPQPILSPASPPGLVGAVLRWKIWTLNPNTPNTTHILVPPFNGQHWDHNQFLFTWSCWCCP